jgi:hypothetical protein
MRVTLDIFSGRPNPSWVLPEKDTHNLVDRFAGRALAAEDAVEPMLGFRGYVISSESDDELQKTKLPERFRIGGVWPREFVGLSGTAFRTLDDDESDDAALWLLNTAKGEIDDMLGSYVEDVVTTRRAAILERPRPVRKHRQAAIATGCLIQNSPYLPAFWNQPSVMPFNNCYNYAMNYRSNTFAQPGRISGQVLSALPCADVVAAATRDGCTRTCTGIAKEVALVVWPGFDFHWYRKHTDGFWAHKVGPSLATNLDSSNRVIGGTLSPLNCDRGPYTDFCAFMFPPLGIIVI